MKQVIAIILLAIICILVGYSLCEVIQSKHQNRVLLETKKQPNNSVTSAYELGKISGLLTYQILMERYDKNYTIAEMKALVDSISGFYKLTAGQPAKQ